MLFAHIAADQEKIIVLTMSSRIFKEKTFAQFHFHFVADKGSIPCCRLHKSNYIYIAKSLNPRTLDNLAARLRLI